MKSKDYYSILGVDKDASSKDIRDAYRKLALVYHPDRNTGSDTSVKMSEINEAYAVLSDHEKRLTFDEMHHKFGSKAREKFRYSYSEKDIYKNSDIDKIFGELSKMFGLRSYEEVFQELLKHGKKKANTISSPFKWSVFKKIGLNDRQRTKKSAIKNIKKASFTSLVLNFLKKTIMPNRIYDKNHHDTICITPELAMTGGKISYLSPITSKKYIVTIPRWVKDGTEIRLEGMGRRHREEEKPGDLLLKICIRQKPFKHLRGIFKRKKSK